jgi:hypothetical protein
MRHNTSQSVIFAIGVLAHLPDGFEDLSIRTAMPIAVDLCSHFFVVRELSKSLFHDVAKRAKGPIYQLWK